MEKIFLEFKYPYCNYVYWVIGVEMKSGIRCFKSSSIIGKYVALRRLIRLRGKSIEEVKLKEDLLKK